jgi:hypothetical protein
MMLEKPLFAEEPSRQEALQVTNDIFMETLDAPNPQHLEKIEDFLVRKIRFFLKDTSIEVDKERFANGSCVDIICLDENHCLVTLTLAWGAYCASGYAFVVTRTNPVWDPISLEAHTCDERSCDASDYDIVTDGMVTPLFYEKPLLSYYLRGAGYYAAIGERRSYLFKNGSLHLIRLHNTRLDEDKSEGVDFSDQNHCYGDYLVDTFECMDPSLSHLYDRFAPKDALPLSQEDAWIHMGFVSTSKTFFHELPDVQTKQKSYAVQGDTLYLHSRQKNWVHGSILSPSGKITSGWILAKDIKTLALEDKDF